ncbi:hypothetical protein AAG906_025891 [Vitis piasezkii]
MDANMYIPPEELEWSKPILTSTKTSKTTKTKNPRTYLKKKKNSPEPPSPLSQPQRSKAILSRDRARKIGAIDGDCIVVGPGGDKVYLKISDRERRRLKKLDLEGRTKGESSFVVAVWLPREWRKRTINAIYEFWAYLSTHHNTILVLKTFLQ